MVSSIARVLYKLQGGEKELQNSTAVPDPHIELALIFKISGMTSYSEVRIGADFRCFMISLTTNAMRITSNIADEPMVPKSRPP